MRNSNKGSIHDMLDAFEDKLNEISYDDIDSSTEIYGEMNGINTSELVQVLMDVYDLPRNLAKKIVGWYEMEDALDDFDSIDDFIEYLDNDIFDMLDSASDEDREAISPYF